MGLSAAQGINFPIWPCSQLHTFNRVPHFVLSKVTFQFLKSMYSPFEMVILNSKNFVKWYLHQLPYPPNFSISIPFACNFTWGLRSLITVCQNTHFPVHSNLSIISTRTVFPSVQRNISSRAAILPALNCISLFMCAVLLISPLKSSSWTHNGSLGS